ncbi:MAG: 5'-methylthioadenosine/adenosylhomocysteine nucleosidase [FCB group bacterium]|nr:5'-methylthioadenosine/adenosylhomocysteine nucleosidase [FCB group bacterium]
MSPVIGIIGALNAEIQEFLKHSDQDKKVTWYEFEFHTARICQQEVVIVQSGVGKVLSAMVCQKLIDDYHPEAILFTGAAGALNKNLGIGDVLIGTESIQHDMYAAGLGFRRGEIPYTNYHTLLSDPELCASALKTRLEHHRVLSGRILTGDQFFTSENRKGKNYLTEELKGDAVEMEGAAIAQVCTINRIPFVLIRTISDLADGNAEVDFNRFLPTVAENSFSVVETILRSMAISHQTVNRG